MVVLPIKGFDDAPESCLKCPLVSWCTLPHKKSSKKEGGGMH